MNKCIKCGIEFKPFHYYVQLENKDFMCEECFFNFALKKLKAKSIHNNYIGEIETIVESGGEDKISTFEHTAEMV